MKIQCFDWEKSDTKVTQRGNILFKNTAVLGLGIFTGIPCLITNKTVELVHYFLLETEIWHDCTMLALCALMCLLKFLNLDGSFVHKLEPMSAHTALGFVGVQPHPTD